MLVFYCHLVILGESLLEQQLEAVDLLGVVESVGESILAGVAQPFGEVVFRVNGQDLEGKYNGK